jgi:hypothetical protein
VGVETTTTAAALLATKDGVERKGALELVARGKSTAAAAAAETGVGAAAAVGDGGSSRAERRAGSAEERSGRRTEEQRVDDRRRIDPSARLFECDSGGERRRKVGVIRRERENVDEDVERVTQAETKSVETGEND